MHVIGFFESASSLEFGKKHHHNHGNEANKEVMLGILGLGAIFVQVNEIIDYGNF